MTFNVLCNSSSARVNRARSTTFDSCRRSHVAVSHSLRRTFKPARARHGRAEADRFDELLCLDRALDARLRLAPPHSVAVSLNLFGQRFDHSLSEVGGAPARTATCAVGSKRSPTPQESANNKPLQSKKTRVFTDNRP